MIRLVLTVSIVALFLVTFSTPIADFFSAFENNAPFFPIALMTQFIQPIISQLDLLVGSFPLVLNFISLVVSLGLVRLAVVSFAK